MAQIVRVAALQLNVVVDLVDHHLQLTGVDSVGAHGFLLGTERKRRAVAGLTLRPDEPHPALASAIRQPRDRSALLLYR